MRTRKDIGPALPTTLFQTSPRMRTRTVIAAYSIFLISPRMRTSGQILGLRCLHHFFWPVRVCAQVDRFWACAAYTIFSDLSAHAHRTDMRPALPTPFFLTCPRMRTRTDVGPALPTPFLLTSPRMRTKTNIGPALPKHLFFWPVRACAQGQILGLAIIVFCEAWTDWQFLKLNECVLHEPEFTHC